MTHQRGCDYLELVILALAVLGLPCPPAPHCILAAPGLPRVLHLLTPVSCLLQSRRSSACTRFTSTSCTEVSRDPVRTRRRSEFRAGVFRVGGARSTASPTRPSLFPPPHHSLTKAEDNARHTVGAHTQWGCREEAVAKGRGLQEARSSLPLQQGGGAALGTREDVPWESVLCCKQELGGCRESGSTVCLSLCLPLPAVAEGTRESWSQSDVPQGLTWRTGP